MIPEAAITEWGRTVPWPTVEQIEQDLPLSRLIVEIANDDYLGDELVFRGGTCLHKLHAPEPLRYSEDLSPNQPMPVKGVGELRLTGEELL